MKVKLLRMVYGERGKVKIRESKTVDVEFDLADPEKTTEQLTILAGQSLWTLRYDSGKPTPVLVVPERYAAPVYTS